ncbi:hypothetical protein [Rubinisphaera sp.]|uniref:hypothetical protein n=1 Tax=Rubinisphaera sp. TaxID=2024857 RepID=UPI0025E24EB1|nr:hypothetical protein [Rubinisphaera sp.]
MLRFFGYGLRFFRGMFDGGPGFPREVEWQEPEERSFSGLTGKRCLFVSSSTPFHAMRGLYGFSGKHHRQS